MPQTPAPAIEPKRIAVIGAGPAGMVCALIAARRGHDVKLIDAEDELGGKLLSASTARIKFDLDNYRSYLVRQVREQTEKPNGT